jgi:hypothetical protein
MKGTTLLVIGITILFLHAATFAGGEKSATNMASEVNDTMMIVDGTSEDGLPLGKRGQVNDKAETDGLCAQRDPGCISGCGRELDNCRQGCELQKRTCREACSHLPAGKEACEIKCDGSLNNCMPPCLKDHKDCSNNCSTKG